MGKKIQKSRKRIHTISTLTKKELEEMAQSLVRRGLASKLILERPSGREDQKNRYTYTEKENY